MIIATYDGKKLEQRHSAAAVDRIGARLQQFSDAFGVYREIL